MSGYEKELTSEGMLAGVRFGRGCTIIVVRIW